MLFRSRRLWRGLRGVDDQGTPAHGLADWYRRGVGGSLRRLGAAPWIVAGIFMAALIGGYLQGMQPEWQIPLPADSSINEAAGLFESYITLPRQGEAILFIVMQNARVLLAATLIGMFTFGVGALILTPVVYVIIGYLFSQVLLAGYDPAFMFAALLPHGIVEIPVIILATAAALRLGAIITRPPPGQTVGRAWSGALIDGLRLWVGIILPGLIVGALLESLLTPRVVLAVLGG